MLHSLAFNDLLPFDFFIDNLYSCGLDGWQISLVRCYCLLPFITESAGGNIEVLCISSPLAGAFRPLHIFSARRCLSTSGV